MSQSVKNIPAKSVALFDYNVFSGSLEEIKPIGHRQIINTINAYSYVVAKHDKQFKNVLKSSDILLPDGFPIVFAARLLGRSTTMKKIAGADLFHYEMKQLNQLTGSCFFLGASPETLMNIKEKAHSDYPNVKVFCYSPPFKREFSKQDNAKIISEINNVKPDVLFIGMTAPKQEKWIYQNIKALNIGTACSIGAVFDFYAGMVKRPSKIWINLGLEWFIRMINEPKRLWKRYLIYSPLFFIDLFLCFLKFKKE
jgi:N-acetylglucosaminyldiphosphoundecaprenol N-acetyl-beta-D-mannosaminyltransferase